MNSNIWGSIVIARGPWISSRLGICWYCGSEKIVPSNASEVEVAAPSAALAVAALLFSRAESSEAQCVMHVIRRAMKRLRSATTSGAVALHHSCDTQPPLCANHDPPCDHSIKCLLLEPVDRLVCLWSELTLQRV